MNNIIWRDDDIGFHRGKLNRFKEIHSLFDKYGVIHTIAVVTKDISKNKLLVDFIKQQKNFDIQVHAYDHDSLKPGGLQKAVSIIKKIFNVTPTILFPAWNISSPELEEEARLNGLKVSNQKISLSQYLRGVKGDIVNFHYWADECKDLEVALIKYTHSV